MNCDKDRLLLFWSQELSDDEMKAVEEHLQSCSECRKEYAELLDFAESFNRTEDAQAPRDFVAEASNQINENKVIPLRAVGRRLLNIPSLGGLAAAAAILIALFIPWSPDSNVETHESGHSFSKSPAISFSSAVKHPRNQNVVTSPKHRFTRKPSLQTRTALLKSKVRMARKRLTTI